MYKTQGRLTALVLQGRRLATTKQVNKVISIPETSYKENEIKIFLKRQKQP